MLYPIITDSRCVMDLSGTWAFKRDEEGCGFECEWYKEPLGDAITMPVPASYNDMKEDEALRETVAEQKKETAAIREKLELEKNRKALSKRRKKTLDRISSLKEVWHVMTPMEKRAVVDQVIERVVVTGQTLQIEYKL